VVTIQLCAVFQNWCFGSFRVKYLNHESMNTARVASVVVSQSAIALYISARTTYGHWTRTVFICNGSKDKVRIARELCHSVII